MMHRPYLLLKNHSSVVNACFNLFWFISDVSMLSMNYVKAFVLKCPSFMIVFFTLFISGMGKDIIVIKEENKKYK